MSRLTTLFALTFVCAVAAGCQRGEPTEQDYNDVALAVGTMVSGDGDSGEVASMEDSVALALGELPTGMTDSGSGEIRGIRGGLEYSYEITCTDADGATLPLCGETTDGARLVLEWSGDLTLPRYSATVNRTGDWSLSDIQSGTAALNGDGTFDLDTEFQALFRPATRTFSLSYAANYDDVLIDTATGFAVGGVASYTIDARRTGSNEFRDVEAEFDMDAVLTFGPDGLAVLELDATRTYNIDLATGSVTAP